MRLLAKFLSLPSGDRLLLFQTVCMLGAIRLGLTLLPFRLIQQLMEPLLQFPQANRAKVLPCSQAAQVDKISWAVAVASRYVPSASCLTQALAAQVLLARRGFPSSIQIGVLHKGSKLEAHAWLTCEGRIVVGGRGHQAYTPLVPRLGKPT